MVPVSCVMKDVITHENAREMKTEEERDEYPPGGGKMDGNVIGRVSPDIDDGSNVSRGEK